MSSGKGCCLMVIVGVVLLSNGKSERRVCFLILNSKDTICCLHVSVKDTIVSNE